MQKKLATTEMLYHQNLLINGDFQINQRGKTSYQSSGYTVDMWRITNNTKVEKLKKGINFCSIIGAAYISQDILDKDYLIGKKTTVCIKVNGNVYSIPITIESAESGADIKVNDSLNLTLYYNYTLKRIRLSLNTESTSNNHIEYIDLFEGDTAYQHQKEDSAIALMRCREYLQVYFKQLGIGVFAKLDTFYMYVHNRFNKNVAIKIIGSWSVINDGHYSTSILNVRSVERFNDVLLIDFEIRSLGSNEQVGRVGRVYSTQSTSAIEISCEPI